MFRDKKERDPVILSAVRTPIGRFQGGLACVPATELGAATIKAALGRANISHLEQIDEVLMGSVVSAGLGQAPARQAAIFSGLPTSVGATTINKVCGSGLKSVMLAAQAILAEDGDLFVSGGMENMSRAPYLVNGRCAELRFGHAQLKDALLLDGLWDPFENWPMGDAAEFIAQEYDISRESMDRYALESHQKAIAAIDLGQFLAEIVAVEVPGRKGQTTLFEIDECPRRDTTFEILAGLKPAFQKDGRVTPGNAPGLNDGAAALVVSSRRRATELGIAPLARIVAYGNTAVEPKFLFDAPARAIPRVLERANLSLADLDLIELNEAFAAQVLANGKALAHLGWDWSKVNINGGSIALGHPIGASGARLLTTLLYALKGHGLKRGLASLCLGGGEAVAMVIELE